MRHWFELCCPCFGDDCQKAYYYWESEWCDVSDADDERLNQHLFIQRVRNQINHKAIADIIAYVISDNELLVGYDRSHINDFINEIIDVMRRNENPFEYIYKIYTQYKGDIYLILTYIEEQGKIGHKCVSDGFTNIHKGWFLRSSTPMIYP